MVEWAIQKEEHLNSAEGYMLLSMYEDALAEIEKILEVETEEPRALYLKSIILIQLRKFDIAETLLNRLVQTKPDYAELYIHLAFIHRRTRGLDAAIEMIGNALRLNPNMPVAYYNLACYYSVKNDAENALKYLKKAIQLDKEYTDAAKTDDDFAPIKDDPRFVALLRNPPKLKNQEN